MLKINIAKLQPIDIFIERDIGPIAMIYANLFSTDFPGAASVLTLYLFLC